MAARRKKGDNMISEFIKDNTYILRGLKGQNTWLGSQEYDYDHYDYLSDTYNFRKVVYDNTTCSGLIYVHKSEQDKTWKAI
jgi:hypothetical protein